jgi:hypothetical protein
MATVQILSQPQDSNAQSFPAMRPAIVHQLALVAGTAQLSALAPQTKVIRICGTTDVYVRIRADGSAATQANDPLVAAAHYQDFVIYPGESVSVISVPGGTCSVTEFG